MERVTFTENELLQALQDATGQPADPDGAYTLGELIDITGRSRAWLHARLHAAMRSGTVLPVMASKADAWGTVHARCAYQFKRAA
jgi:hypothetical protein